MSFKMEYVDIVHGCFFIPKDIKDIIETAQFQRLKNIKQLGLLYKFYPQVNHTRYDHCIGTYFLANKAIDNLEKNTANLKVPEFYKKAVSIAALLHDIAHGPFSHTWETINDGDYNHEENAGGCVDEIFKVSFLEWKMDRPYLIQLIKSLIKGDSSCLRDQQFQFLFDIVNNKHCKIDVDKLDYLKRDFKYLNGIKPLDVDMDFEDVFISIGVKKKQFLLKVCITDARASNDRTHMEYRYCDFRKIYNIFEARAIFHIKFYRSPYLNCLENILKNLVLSNETELERICGINIKDIRSKDVNEFLKLDDDRILDSLKRLNASDGTLSLVKCFEKASIKEIYPITEEEKLAVPEHLIIKSRIANAGEEIQIEDIRFYGNETELPIFEQKKGYFEAISYFKTVF